MKKIILFLITGLIFLFSAHLFAENYTLQLKIDIVESKNPPGKQLILENFDKLFRRNTGIETKYIIGGSFTLQEFLQNSFVLKGKDIELVLRAGYSKITDYKFKIYYNASLSFPMQEDSAKFTNDLIMEYNEIKIINKTKLPDGPADTRPYWVVLRLVKVEPEYFEEDIGGIGAFLNIRDGYPYILDVTPNGPADRQGLKGGDIITEIDGVDMYGKNLQESIDKTRGKPGTSVKLKIKPANRNEPREVTIERVVK